MLLLHPLYVLDWFDIWRHEEWRLEVVLLNPSLPHHFFLLVSLGLQVPLRNIL